MKNFRKEILLIVLTIFLSVNATSQNKTSIVADSDSKIEKKSKKKKKRKKYKLPDIDLSHWKVTLPVSNEKGKPYEIEPPEILNFASNEIAKPYMYIDSTKGAIVFHAMPTYFYNNKYKIFQM